MTSPNLLVKDKLLNQLFPINYLTTSDINVEVVVVVNLCY